MAEDPEKGPEILDAHRELVSRIEQSAGRMRALAMITVVVAAALSISYVLQLALPLAGTTVQTVNLTDPTLVAAELVVLALALLWLYVGISDLRFSWRIRGEIGAALEKEKSLRDRLPAAGS